MRVTRGNEARYRGFADAVRDEHHALVDAIAAHDASAARRAATRHMGSPRAGSRGGVSPRRRSARERRRNDSEHDPAWASWGSARWASAPRVSALRRGVDTWGLDMREEARAALRRARAAAAPRSLAELGAHCDVVVVLVVNAAQTEAVLFGADGLAAHAAARLR